MNSHRSEAPEYRPGDKVWINISKRTGEQEKLNPRCFGPVTIQAKTGNDVYAVHLPQHMSYMHNVFDTKFLNPYVEARRQSTSSCASGSSATSSCTSGSRPSSSYTSGSRMTRPSNEVNEEEDNINMTIERDRNDIKLHPMIFKYLCSLFRFRPTIDLFANAAHH